MTLADTTRLHSRRLVIGAAVGLLIVAGGVTGSTYYYDSVPLAESPVAHPVVALDELPLPVTNAFRAAVDPGDGSVLARQYAAVVSGADGLRLRVVAHKAESAYPREEILERYLNRADFGRASVGLVAAAQTYFQKPAAQLSVAEAAVLAVRLHPDRPTPEAGWEQVMDTMVEQGWLSQTERNSLFYPR